MQIRRFRTSRVLRGVFFGSAFVLVTGCGGGSAPSNGSSLPWLRVEFYPVGFLGDNNLLPWQDPSFPDITAENMQHQLGVINQAWQQCLIDATMPAGGLTATGKQLGFDNLGISVQLGDVFWANDQNWKTSATWKAPRQDTYPALSGPGRGLNVFWTRFLMPVSGAKGVTPPLTPYLNNSNNMSWVVPDATDHWKVAAHETAHQLGITKDNNDVSGSLMNYNDPTMPFILLTGYYVYGSATYAPDAGSDCRVARDMGRSQGYID